MGGIPHISFVAFIFSCVLQTLVLAQINLEVENLRPADVSEALQLPSDNVAEDTGKPETTHPLRVGDNHVTFKKEESDQITILEDNTNPPFPSQSSPFWERDEDEPLPDYDDGTNPAQVHNTVTPGTMVGNEAMSEDSTSGIARNAHDQRPNIILIITDDQDVELGSMEYMPETLKVFRDAGVEFRHGYVSTPICCPSRSSLLTGLYVHNHEVFTNNDNCSSINWREKFEKETFASHLWTSGYYTSYIGKYLNKYDGSHIPHGWDEWNGLLMNSRYYNYTLNRNGKRIRYGYDLERDYYPDAIARDGLDFLERVTSDSSKQPFLLVLSFPSPHGPEDSAPKYSNLYFNATPHHTPSYNYAPNLDKQWILRVTDKMTPMLKEFTNLLMTKRLQTLQSVDIAVRDIFRKLETSGFRDSTYAFYTSDHGYHVGQFGLVKGKSMPYEFDIRVPFFLTGPASMVNGGTVIHEPVLNIDFAPTFLDLANLSIPDEMDGRSMVPLIKKYCPSCSKDETFSWPDVFLIESPGRRHPPGSSGSGSGEAVDKQQSRRLQKRRNREKVVFDDDEALSLTRLCEIHPHPCMPGQKKYCRKEKNRIRFRKCRQNIDFLVSTRFLAQDVRINDPVYGHNVSLTDVSNPKCSCRFKRSTTRIENLEDDRDDVLDWETERHRIDDEIEKLKQRIDFLRQRRKEIRRKWLADHTNSFRTGLRMDGGGTKPRGREERKHRKGNNGKNTQSPPMDDNNPVQQEDYDDASNESEEGKDGEEDSLEDEVGNNNTNFDNITEFKERPIATSGHDSHDRVQVDGELGENNSVSWNSNKSEPERDDVVFTSSTISPSSNSSKDNDPDDTEPQVPMSSTTRKAGGQHRGKSKHQNRNKLKGSYLFNKHPDPEVEGEEDTNCNCYNDPRWLRQKEREDRKHRKILSKLRKKQRLSKRIEDPLERQQAETCGKEEKMNCFWHDSDHWRTAPFWTSGSFCFCMNANNNSYSCLRSVNTTHNYLYCQFVTGFKMYFDLRKDPHQLKNVIDMLPATSEDWIMARLYKLQQCKGKEECWSDDSSGDDSSHLSLWEQIFGRPPKKRRKGGRRRKYQGT